MFVSVRELWGLLGFEGQLLVHDKAKTYTGNFGKSRSFCRDVMYHSIVVVVSFP